MVLADGKLRPRLQIEPGAPGTRRGLIRMDELTPRASVVQNPHP
jgi:hypothetical protein